MGRGSSGGTHKAWREQVSLVLFVSDVEYYESFFYYSALCGIIATTVKDGNIFKFEDNVCSVGIYNGIPEHYEDDQVRV